MFDDFVSKVIAKNIDVKELERMVDANVTEINKSISVLDN
jgi:hypothetical protein